MAQQRYVVVPGVLFVAGAPAPADRLVMLSPEEARFDLELGRIYLDGTQPPPVTLPDPVLGTDLLYLIRGGLSQPASVAELKAFLGIGGLLPTITLSTTTFASGAAQGAILAAIGAPLGWTVTAETTFGGRVAVSDRNLVAAQALNADATGTLRLRATSPLGLEAIIKTFDVAVTGTVSPPADTTAPTITTAATFSVAENTPLVIPLTADEVVSWAKVGGADAALFTLVGATLTFAAKDFELPTDSGADNRYDVVVEATDGAGNKSQRAIRVTVTDVNETVPDTTAPTILTAATFSVAENTPLVVQLTANEAVTWTKSGGADAALWTLNTSAVPPTLTLAARDFEAPADDGADNTYRVEVRAVDAAGNPATLAITATVTNVLEGTMATLSPATVLADARDPASTVILALPPLVEGETRSYLPTTGPSFPFNSAGQLIRGIATFGVDTVTGRIRQTRGGVNTDTPVRLWLAAAEPMGLGTVGTYAVTHQVDSLAQWNALAPKPGDVIALKRGITLAGPLTLPNTVNGTEAQPIVLTAYGTGDAPVITGAATAYASALTINGSWFVVDGLTLGNSQNAGLAMGYYGAPFRPHHIKIRNCTIFGTGLGVTANGDNIDVLHCEMRDLRMVVNTDGGGKTVQVAGEPSVAAWDDDDYGANAIVVSGANVRMGFCKVLNGRAGSFDYGVDGGMAEIYASGDAVSDVLIDSNYTERNVGLIEAGGAYGTSAVIRRLRVTDNVGVNLAQGVVAHNDAPGGGFSATFVGCSIDHNTMVEEYQTRQTAQAYVTYNSGAASQTAGLRFDDNIVALNEGDSVFKQQGDYHARNCFLLLRADPASTGSGQAGYTHLYNNWQMGLGTGEIYADPKFLDQAKRDFRLAADSPAASMGSRSAALAVPATVPRFQGSPTGLLLALTLPASA